MFNIDVHILKMGRDSEEYFESCLRSLENEPINVYFESGILGKLGQARINGFDHGSAEFVSYVDPDDIIKPGIFQKMISAWDDDCCGMYCDYERIDEHGNFLKAGITVGQEYSFEKMVEHPTNVHQLIIYKRKTVDKYKHLMKDYMIYPENILNIGTAHFEGKPFKHFNEVGYCWRHCPKDRSFLKFNEEKIRKNNFLKEILG